MYNLSIFACRIELSSIRSRLPQEKFDLKSMRILGLQIISLAARDCFHCLVFKYQLCTISLLNSRRKDSEFIFVLVFSKTSFLLAPSSLQRFSNAASCVLQQMNNSLVKNLHWYKTDLTYILEVFCLSF